MSCAYNPGDFSCKKSSTKKTISKGGDVTYSETLDNRGQKVTVTAKKGYIVRT